MSAETSDREIPNPTARSRSDFPDTPANARKSPSNSFIAPPELEITQVGKRPGNSGGQADETDSSEDSFNSRAGVDQVELIPDHPYATETEPEPWRAALSEKLNRLREKRVRSRSGFDASRSLDLEFRNTDANETITAPEVTALNLGRSQSQATLGDGWRQAALRDTRAGTDDWAAQEITPDPPEEQWSLELDRTVDLQEQSLGDDAELVGSHAGASTLYEEIPPLMTAPLGRRFMAGVLDALVLLAGAALFALIFLGLGGRLSSKPADLAILGSITLIFGLGYFGCFTAAVSATPGLLLTNLEVRNLEGAPATASDSVLRALGYLVSTSALMLGFVWAAVDSERMTWHDRMSGTFIASRDTA